MFICYFFMFTSNTFYAIGNECLLAVNFMSIDYECLLVIRFMPHDITYHEVHIFKKFEIYHLHPTPAKPSFISLINSS